MHPLLPTLGIPELLIILVIVLIFFGVGKLPEIGRAMGQGIKSFRQAQGELDKKVDIEVTPEDGAGTSTGTPEPRGGKNKG